MGRVGGYGLAPACAHLYVGTYPLVQSMFGCE